MPDRQPPIAEAVILTAHATGQAARPVDVWVDFDDISLGGYVTVLETALTGGVDPAPGVWLTAADSRGNRCPVRVVGRVFGETVVLCLDRPRFMPARTSPMTGGNTDDDDT